jgi:hypothetical protein
MGEEHCVRGGGGGGALKTQSAQNIAASLRNPLTSFLMSSLSKCSIEDLEFIAILQVKQPTALCD